MKSKKALSPLIALVLFLLGSVNVSADQYQCNSKEIAEQAKEILEKSKFFIQYCSNCSAQEEPIKRINISTIEIENTSCDHELLVKGKVVRGILPPVSAGECTEKLEVFKPSMRVNAPYEKRIDLAYTYVWNKETKEFRTVAELLGLDTKNICLPKLILHR